MPHIRPARTVWLSVLLPAARVDLKLAPYASAAPRPCPKTRHSRPLPPQAVRAIRVPGRAGDLVLPAGGAPCQSSARGICVPAEPGAAGLAPSAPGEGRGRGVWGFPA